MATVRVANATWTGDLMSGSTYGCSPTWGCPSWAAQTEESNGKSNTEELIPAAHASCFCMALSVRLD